jgi:hypothetical protein
VTKKAMTSQGWNRVLSSIVALAMLGCTAEEGAPVAARGQELAQGSAEAGPVHYVEPAPPFVDPSKIYAQPAGTSVELFKTAQGYVIEVRDPEGFPVRAEDPFLHIGSAVFRSNGLSHRVGPYGMIYRLTAEQFDALEEGAEIATGHKESPSKSYGTLSRAALAVERQ